MSALPALADAVARRRRRELAEAVRCIRAAVWGDDNQLRSVLARLEG